jgi:hypothetical protein
MSVGGVIGGAFASLAAPYLFHSIAEYPILIVASLLVLRRVWGQGARTVVLGLSAALAVGWLVPKIAGAVLDTSALAGQIGLNAIALALASLVMAWRRPLLAVALFAIAVQFTTHMSSINPPLDVRRSFFGVTTVSNSEDGRHRRMLHGTTLHGAMRLDEAGDRPEPLTYYHSTSGMALAIADARARNTGSSVSEPAVSHATARPASIGISSRSTATSSTWRPIRPCSASCPNAPGTAGSSSAMPASNWPRNRPAATMCSSSTLSHPIPFRST